MPDNYVVPPNGPNHVVTMSISTRVADVSANVRGQNRVNRASVLWTDTTDRTRNSNTVTHDDRRTEDLPEQVEQRPAELGPAG